MIEKKKILYINNYDNDFLADSFLIGLKSLEPNIEVVELPINNYIYKNSELDGAVHGMGFTLSGVIDASRKNNFRNQYLFTQFDLFIFGSIHRSFHFYIRLLPFLTKSNTIIIDQEDFNAPLGYYGYFWRRPYLWFLPKPHKRFDYYKREFIKEEILYWRFFKLIPKSICKYLPLNKNFKTISYSYPEEKIVIDFPLKSKLFVKHIVDEEVAKNVPDSYIKYAFKNEKEYYSDIQQSKYGITTKRGGWDCLRHYEIAGNGAVICFKNLHLKAETCAPHGLIHNVNCISYYNYHDLKDKINRIDEIQYKYLQENSLKWIKSKTCKKVVSDILKNYI